MRTLIGAAYGFATSSTTVYSLISSLENTPFSVVVSFTFRVGRTARSSPSGSVNASPGATTLSCAVPAGSAPTNSSARPPGSTRSDGFLISATRNASCAIAGYTRRSTATGHVSENSGTRRAPWPERSDSGRSDGNSSAYPPAHDAARSAAYDGGCQPRGGPNA